MTVPTRLPANTSRKAARTPDFFIVGHPKSGTTALYEMLRRHPQIYMPELKETRFFAPELHPRTLELASHPRTLAEYLALFAAAGPDQRAGEASPSYLRSRDAARRIAELQPDARIIAILREPASFIRSLHLELLQDHVETERDLRKAMSPNRHTRTSRESRDLSDSPAQREARYSLERVEYVAQLRRYHAVFPSAQILVLVYDDFRADNKATLRRVLDFLDVDDSLAIAPIDANPTVQVRSVKLYAGVRSLYLGQGRVARTVKRAIKTLTPRKLRHGGLTALRRRVLYARPAAADEDLMLELRRRFHGEVVALSEYLGRDLVAEWGYDSID